MSALAIVDTPEEPFNNDQLADKITMLAGQINAANYRFLKLIAEFDRREAWAGFGIRSCAHWLHWQCGITLSAARERVRTARALDGLPAINEAFEKGELSFSKVRAMTRVATTDNESYLLMIAEHGTVQQMEKLVKTFRKVERLNEGLNESLNEKNKTQDVREDECIQLQQEKRSVFCFQDDDGMWIIQAKLPAEEGGLVANVLKELGDQLAENQNMGAAERKSVSAETLLQNEDIAGHSENIEKLTFSQRRADALVAMSEHFLASSEHVSLKAADRCQLVLHVQAGVSGVGLNSADNSHLEGRWLLPSAARRLACDAGLLVVKEDAAGNVLDIGRKSRVIPPAMSRALALRDGGCQYPGCCETRYVEGHHIKHWADGGETKLDNLVTLCRYHHRELHRGAFFLSLKPDSNKSAPNIAIRFSERLCFSKIDCFYNSPMSRSKDFVIAANPAKFTCACCDFSELDKTLNEELSEQITEKTAVTKWAGERMDLSMTLDGLLNKKK